MATSVRLKGDYEDRIRRLAAATGRSQSFYINQMIEREIDQIEREYTILRDVEAYRAGRLRTFSADQVDQMLGLVGEPVPVDALNDIS